jgi:thioredoxin-like negative regulator of GroEL
MPAIARYSEEQREFVRQAYVGEGLQTAAIVGALNARFGTAYSAEQVQGLIHRHWSKPRRATAAQLRALGGAPEPAVVRELVSRAMDSFAERAVAGAQRAFALLETAEDARALATAAAAAKSLVALARACAGLDAAGASGEGGAAGAAAFDFDFGNVVPEPAAGGEKAEGLGE